MIKSLKIFLPLIVFIQIFDPHESFSARLKLGYGGNAISFEHPDGETTGFGSNDQDSYYHQCNVENNACISNDNGSVYDRNQNPFVGLETDPSYFFDSNWGYFFSSVFFVKNKSVILDFPKRDENTEINTNKNSLGLGLFYLWGDKELGRNGNVSARLGYNISASHYEVTLQTKDEVISKTSILTESGPYFTIDWGIFEISFLFVGGGKIYFNELKDDERNTAGFMSKNTTYYFALNYYI